MNRFTVTLLTFIVVAPVALVRWIALQPPPGRPNVLVAFLGYSNGPTGARLARFAVTNLSASAVGRQVHSIEISTPTGLTNQFASRFWAAAYPMPVVLGAGASEVFAVPAPTDQPPWRMSLIFYPDAGAGRALKWPVTTALMRIGVKARYRIMRYQFYGPWIGSEQQP
jgi:hypothetical protein